MRVVILAGGFGTRLSEESHLKPKPMIEIGGRPILWHIMKIYAYHGFNDFVICLGYKGYVIKEYFANYFLHESNVTYDFTEGNTSYTHEHNAEPWKVTLVDTGNETMTGGRVKRIQPYIGNKPFMLTYGDGVGDIDINELVTFHKAHGKLATMTSTQPSGRFGALKFGDNNLVTSFREKPAGDGGWINAGFFIMQPNVFDYIADDFTILEQDPLENLAIDRQLVSYRHRGYWQPMDTLRDKTHLEKLLKINKAPWVTW